MAEPGRLDKDGVEWWACDPYPTWFRYEGDRLIERDLDPTWLGNVDICATQWVGAPELSKHIMEPEECYGTDNHYGDCDGIVRGKWSGVGCKCGARWYCA